MLELLVVIGCFVLLMRPGSALLGMLAASVVATVVMFIG